MAFVAFARICKMQLVIYKCIKTSSNVTRDAEVSFDIKWSIAVQMASLLEVYDMD